MPEPSLVTFTVEIDGKNHTISNTDSFNAFCASLVGSQASANNRISPTFSNHINRVSEIDSNIRTDWGGVDIEFWEHPNYKKYLVIRGGTWLALEKHDEKEETIKLIEGSAFLLLKKHGESTLSLIELKQNVPISIHPGEEHCIIAKDNSVVYEYGKDPKGMDKDLIFLFMPDPRKYNIN